MKIEIENEDAELIQHALKDMGVQLLFSGKPAEALRVNSLAANLSRQSKQATNNKNTAS